MDYPVYVKDGNHQTYFYREQLKKFHLHYWKDSCYIGRLSEKDAFALERFCRRKQLYYSVTSPYGKRSDNYREEFFQTRSPDFGKRYFCVYCGKLLPPRKIEIDHLYPIGKAKHSIRRQKKLRCIGLTSINDPKNLVASCRRCNRAKGTQTGMWLWRGCIGQIKGLWLFRWVTRISILALLTAVLFRYMWIAVIHII